MPFILAALAGCAGTSPLAEQSERELRRNVLEATTRELADARRQPAPVETAYSDGVQRLGIRKDILEELAAMGGPGSYAGTPLDLGFDLLGTPAKGTAVSLRDAMRTATAHNIAVQFARLSPAVSQAQVLAAEAAFDWTVFSNLNVQETNSPRVSTGTGTVATTPNSDQNRLLGGNVGLRRQLVGGGRFTVQADMSETDDTTQGEANTPNPANSSSVTLQWDQPLLRGFGSDVALAEVRLARNAERTNVQTLQRDLTRTLTDTERTYWNLVRAYRELQIVTRLLERGEKVRDQLKQRANIDANSAQIADAIARVERRRADVLRARTQLRTTSDQLKTLINDPDMPVGSEVIMIPADDAVDAPVRFSLMDSIASAVQHRPEVQQAIIAIDDASIRQQIARGQRLPDLNLRLQTRFSDISDEPGEAAVDQFSGKFVDYLLGLSFETGVGNRRGESEYRRRRLERLQSTLAYQNQVQVVVTEVKNAINRVALNYSLIDQTRASRIAASEVLRVLEVEKEQGEGFTVERLNIELNNQESLAASEREEVQALVDYNIALADLFSAMGTTLERNGIVFVVPGTSETIDAQP